MRWNAKRIALSVLVVLVAGIGIFTAVKWQEIERARFVASMFSGADEVENFRNMDAIFPSRKIARAGAVYDIPQGAPLDLPATYSYEGKTLDTAKFLAATDTTGLLIVKDGKIVHEQYWRGNDKDTRWISWSVGKSFISALVGIAVGEGKIASVDDPLTKYAPELIGTGYEGVSIKNALQMSSGVSWNEDYSDKNSDIARFGRTLAFGGSMVEFAKSLKRAHAPGTVNHYNSMDAQVLGLVLLHATGKTPSDYLSEKIWSKIGAARDGYWVLDDTGTELAAGGVNVTLRDYAKFGLLYLHEGNWMGEQLVPRDWVKASHTPDAPQLVPGKRDNADDIMGYGYLWWLPETADGPFSAIGIYNQFVYVDPAHDLVIAKTSANHTYGADTTDASYREHETFALFRAIADKASRP
ncbi:MAG: serine hydrolase [Parvibaculum sp.]|uniref:serine hydrolase domain-containing protein n=1 Tax=Parvibaculum sp. TaxID=2024848 RepID=UPI002843F821|nr:serine hydrolase [Parvibaculum sp.]MDR3500615.1 serine hydrolase [Parvibaculum sp.]